MGSSAPGHSVRLKIPATDNKSTATIPLIYKVKIGSLTFFYQSTDMSIASWTGFCECDIPLRLGTQYHAIVTLLDMSGNKNKKPKQISFSIPNYSSEIKINDLPNNK
jgi:hypothetical protein